MSTYQAIEPAKLDWLERTPKSHDFEDVYFSTDGGLDESRYVFLQANKLPERWQGRASFSIAETGFGTGLNFLATVEAWLAHSETEAVLHYVSVEKHPLQRDDLGRALACWPALEKFSNELIQNYPELTPGYHRRSLFNGRVQLTLMLGDAEEMLGELHANIDTWYLDGFAPSKNPDMWSDRLFHHIARLSHEQTWFSTFSAAGVVRRGLQAVGFATEKLKGFGKKREMLRGQYQACALVQEQQPWFALKPQKSPNPTNKHAVVIGAGLAGATTAYALAQRGWQVQVLERHHAGAQEASGNHSGVVLPRLTATMNQEGQFYLASFLYATQWLNQLDRQLGHFGWHRSGVIQIEDDSYLEKLALLDLPSNIMEIIDQQRASSLAGTSIKTQALHYPLGAWLSPARLCQQLLKAHPNIQLITQANVVSLQQKDTQWQITTERGQHYAAPTVVLCSAYDTNTLLDQALPLNQSRGQLSYCENTPDNALLTPVCFDGYIIPSLDNLHCVGATYDRHSKCTDLLTGDEQKNLAALAQALPDFAQAKSRGGRVAFRTSSQDHLPIIGPMIDRTYYLNHYTHLKHGQPAHCYPPANYQANLYVNTGHGSRGLTTTPVAAEFIANLINNEPASLPTSLQQCIHPGRFLVRQLRKGLAQ